MLQLSLSGKRAARLRGRPRPLPGAAGRAAVERAAARGRAGQGQGADAAGGRAGRCARTRCATTRSWRASRSSTARPGRWMWRSAAAWTRWSTRRSASRRRSPAGARPSLRRSRRAAAPLLSCSARLPGAARQRGLGCAGVKTCVVLGKTGLSETCGFGWAGCAMPICSVALGAFDLCRTLAGRQGCGKLDVQQEPYQRLCKAVLQLADGVGPPACSARATRRWRLSGRSAPWRARCGGARSMYAAAAWSWRSGGARSVAPPAVFTQDRI